jgi:hypothetical protein
MSPIALLGLSLGVLCVGAVLAAITTRVNVTALERGVTAGRVAALVALLAIGTGIGGAGIAVWLLLRG